MENRQLTYVEAIREATDQALEADKSVVLFGVDVDSPKGIYGTTNGLSKKYGQDRVFSTPLSDDAVTGAAVGMALAGLRPIYVHTRVDFLMTTMNQLVNVAAKSYYMYGGQVNVPLVIRAIIGRGWGQGSQYSQSLHAMFMHVPGLKVVMPATAYDAKGCLLQAVNDNNPVIFIEHQLLYPKKDYVPEQKYYIEPNKAKITRTGNRATIVGISYMQQECLRAAEYLNSTGYDVEVIDPIWLSPLDIDTIALSAQKTGVLCVVDNGWLMCGASAEIITGVVERVGNVKVKRIGFAPTPCPSSKILEKSFYPDSINIAHEVRQLIENRPNDWYPTELEEFKEVDPEEFS